MASKLILTPEELAVFLKKEKFGFALLGICLLVPLLVWARWIAAEINRRAVITEPRTIIIEKSAGFLEIIDILEQNKITRSAPLKLYLLITGNAGKIKTGTYVFTGETSVASVARQLIQGPSDIQVTIPEGYTFFDIDKRLANIGLISRGEIIEAARDPEKFAYSFLRSDEIVSLEGFLFPDTYRFSQTMNAYQIIDKILGNF